MTEQKYYVKLMESKKGYLNSFLGILEPTHLCLTSKDKSNGKFKSQFTEEEIKSIDERYWQFAVPVEDGELNVMNVI